MMICERCGATEKEAGLSVSHAPQTAVAKILGGHNWGFKMRKYCLCLACHMRYSVLEKQILQQACELMIQRHEEYINQK
jgi:hypothetical protein